jgi:hypothetical protein
VPSNTIGHSWFASLIRGFYTVVKLVVSVESPVVERLRKDCRAGLEAGILEIFEVFLQSS